MSMQTISISESSHGLLCQLAAKTGQTSSEILDKALDAYRRHVFFDELNAGYTALRADPEAWANMEAERKLWDSTLMDGLDPAEHWSEDGRCLTPDEENR